ncbi:MAG: integrase core domain-containing protein [Xanthobacteraceae bacterium]
MGIRDRPTAPRSPWQNPHVERLIGTLRRECLDHLPQLLRSYFRYYNETRTHLGLDKDTPLPRPGQRSGTIVHLSCPDCTTLMLGPNFREAQVSVPSRRKPNCWHRLLLTRPRRWNVPSRAMSTGRVSASTICPEKRPTPRSTCRIHRSGGSVRRRMRALPGGDQRSDDMDAAEPYGADTLRGRT